MDWYELKIRARQTSDAVRSLSWKNPDERRVLVVLIGGGILAVLVPVVAWRLLAPALSTTEAERAARLNEPIVKNDSERAAMDRIREQLAPRLHDDDRFGGLILRPGASAEAQGAIATVQGTVGTRQAFDSVVALIDELGLGEAVHLRIAIDQP